MSTGSLPLTSVFSPRLEFVSLEHVQQCFIFLDDRDELLLRHETVRVLVQLGEQLLTLAQVSLRTQHLVHRAHHSDNNITVTLDNVMIRNLFYELNLSSRNAIYSNN